MFKQTKKKIDLIYYLKNFNLVNLTEASTSDFQSIFILICQDYFSHQISISTFSFLAGELYLPSIEKNCDQELICILDLAQDLSYQFKQDRTHYFLFLKEIMTFYLNYSSQQSG